MEYNIQSAIDYLNLIISQRKEVNENKFGLKLNIVDDSNNVIDNITNYYNSQLVSCTMKYCVLEKDYEIIIWW
jgi:hypothetical protein